MIQCGVAPHPQHHLPCLSPEWGVLYCIGFYCNTTTTTKILKIVLFMTCTSPITLNTLKTTNSHSYTLQQKFLSSDFLSLLILFITELGERSTGRKDKWSVGGYLSIVSSITGVLSNAK